MLQKSKYLVKLEFFPSTTEQNEEGSSFSPRSHKFSPRFAQDLSAVSTFILFMLGFNFVWSC